MSQFHSLTFATAVLLSAIPRIANADLVLWTAQGKISTIAGTFKESGIQTDDTVEFRMSYDDRAEMVETKNVFGLVEADFRKNIHLTVTVTIRESTWSGTIPSGADPLPATLFTRFYSFPGTEVLKATLDRKDGASISVFPFAPEETANTISAEFTGPNTFLGIGIESLEIDPSVLTAATGFLRSGSNVNQLDFVLNPTTVSVIDLADEPFDPVMTLASLGNELDLTWTSDPRFSYRLEAMTELAAEGWTPIDFFEGTGGPMTRSLPREERSTYFRIVTSFPMDLRQGLF